MIDECNEIAKLANEATNRDPNRAIELHKQAAECFDKQNKLKERNLNLEKAAKLLREAAKSKDDPIKALDYYEKSSSIYSQMGNEVDAEKIMNEAQQKLINAAKIMRSRGKKLEDIYLAEQKFRRASEYALLAKDENLSKECWVDSGDQFRKAAINIHDPREADEMFKHAIFNYRKGQNLERETLSLRESADKYDKTASNLYKVKKDLVFAFDNYIQAATIYSEINSEDKAQFSASRAHEISETIGINKDNLVNFIIRQEISPISDMGQNIWIRDNVHKSKKSLDLSIERINTYETGKPPKTGNIIENLIPVPALKKSSKLRIPNVENLNSQFGRDIKERRRQEMRQGINNSQTGKFKETKNSAEINNLIEDVLEDSLEAILPGFTEFIVDEDNGNNTLIEKTILDENISETPFYDELIHDLDLIDQSIYSNPVTEETKVEAPIHNRLVTPQKKTYDGILSPPIVDILKFQGYINDVLAPLEELLKIPEYRILSLIIQQHPISLDQIEKRTGIETISLALSNLQADELITQTNDYQWTISQKVIDTL